MTDTKLWAVHIEGPDDVHPAPDEETAKRWAAGFNVWADGLEKHPHRPRMKATVQPWSHSAELHREYSQAAREEFCAWN